MHKIAKHDENHLNQASHGSIHWKTHAEHFQMSNHVSGFQSFSGILHHFTLISKLATSRERLNPYAAGG